MKKLRSSGGFTLIEMLATLLILVFLILGIDTGMDSALRIYDEAKFQSNSASMANIVNTSLGDILRYAVDVEVVDPNVGIEKTDTTGTHKVTGMSLVFTNYEYGVRGAYFTLNDLQGTETGILRMNNSYDNNIVELVNTGAYPDLKMKNFEIQYVPLTTDGDGNNTAGGYFELSYTVYSEKDSSLTRDVEYIIRSMNPF